MASIRLNKSLRNEILESTMRKLFSDRVQEELKEVEAFLDQKLEDHYGGTHNKATTFPEEVQPYIFKRSCLAQVYFGDLFDSIGHKFLFKRQGVDLVWSTNTYDIDDDGKRFGLKYSQTSSLLSIAYSKTFNITAEQLYDKGLKFGSKTLPRITLRRLAVLVKDISETSSQLEDLLNSVSTVKKLVELAPDLEVHVPKKEPKCTQIVPVNLVNEINRKLSASTNA